MKKIQVFISDDDFLLNQEVNKIIRSLAIDSFNVIRYSYTESNPLEIINELETVSLLEGSKVVVLTNPEFLFSDYKQEKYVEAFEKFFFTDDIPNYLIILSNKSLESNHITNVLKTVADINQIEEVSADKMSQWIINNAIASGYQMEVETANELIERCSSNMMLISTELEKLKTYKEGTNTIDYKDVILMVPKALDDDIRELVSAFISGNKDRVMSMYADMMLLNEKPESIINAFENKLEELLYLKEMLKQGYSTESIAGTFNYKSTKQANFMIRFSKSISDVKLLSLIEKITDLEYQFKSGKIDKNIGLELFLLGA